MGHIHLSVKDSQLASTFYQDVLELADKFTIQALVGLLQVITTITLLSTSGAEKTCPNVTKICLVLLTTSLNWQTRTTWLA